MSYLYIIYGLSVIMTEIRCPFILFLESLYGASQMVPAFITH